MYVICKRDALELFMCIYNCLLVTGPVCFQGADSLRPLLEEAATYIPQSKWRETSIALKATAGLRMLSNETAAEILEKVKYMSTSCMVNACDFCCFAGVCGGQSYCVSRSNVLKDKYR